MYVNPFPFGIFIGSLSTIVIEVAILIIIAAIRSNQK